MKKLVLLALAVAAMTGGSLAAVSADEPVGGLTNSSGCGIHLENHGGTTPFYKSDGAGGWTPCTADDAHP